MSVLLNETNQYQAEKWMKMEREVAALSSEQREYYEQLAIKKRIVNKLKRRGVLTPEAIQNGIQHYHGRPSIKQIYEAMQNEKRNKKNVSGSCGSL